MQRRIEGALIHLHYRPRDLVHSLGDAVSVQRLHRDNLQNQHIQRALGNGETFQCLNLLPVRVHYDMSKVKACRRPDTSGNHVVSESSATEAIRLPRRDWSFHEKAGMSQVCFSVFSLFLLRMFLFFSSSL